MLRAVGAFADRNGALQRDNCGVDFTFACKASRAPAARSRAIHSGAEPVRAFGSAAECASWDATI